MEILEKLQSILVVEDSDDDFEIMMEGFDADTTFKNPVVRCEDGRDALNYLFHEPPYEDAEEHPRPGIILLDLNLPGIDGREALRRIKQSSKLSRIPVIVLTTSNDERDIQECYSLGANSYIQKPVDLGKFLEAVQRLKEYWLGVAILPKE